MQVKIFVIAIAFAFIVVIGLALTGKLGCLAIAGKLVGC